MYYDDSTLCCYLTYMILIHTSQILLLDNQIKKEMFDILKNSISIFVNRTSFCDVRYYYTKKLIFLFPRCINMIVHCAIVSINQNVGIPAVQLTTIIKSFTHTNYAKNWNTANLQYATSFNLLQTTQVKTH